MTNIHPENKGRPPTKVHSWGPGCCAELCKKGTASYAKAVMEAKRSEPARSYSDAVRGVPQPLNERINNVRHATRRIIQGLDLETTKEKQIVEMVEAQLGILLGDDEALMRCLQEEIEKFLLDDTAKASPAPRDNQKIHDALYPKKGKVKGKVKGKGVSLAAELIAVPDSEGKAWEDRQVDWAIRASLTGPQTASPRADDRQVTLADPRSADAFVTPRKIPIQDVEDDWNMEDVPEDDWNMEDVPSSRHGTPTRRNLNVAFGATAAVGLRSPTKLAPGYVRRRAARSPSGSPRRDVRLRTSTPWASPLRYGANLRDFSVCVEYQEDMEKARQEEARQVAAARRVSADPLPIAAGQGEVRWQVAEHKEYAATGPRIGEHLAALRTMNPSIRQGPQQNKHYGHTRVMPGRYEDTRVGMINNLGIQDHELATATFLQGGTAGTMAAAAAMPKEVVGAVSDSITKLKLTTLKDYEKKFNNAFIKPFYNVFYLNQLHEGRKHHLRDLVYQDVMMWLNFMLSEGSKSGASIKQMLLAARAMWKIKVASEGFDVQLNPFAHDAVVEMQSTLNTRVKMIDDAGPIRKALE